MPPAKTTRAKSAQTPRLRPREVVGFVCVSGDARVTQQIIQRPNSQTLDRFADAYMIDDFRLPTGTFVLEALLNAAARAAKDFAKDVQHEYEVWGPRRRVAGNESDYTTAYTALTKLPRESMTIRQVDWTGGADSTRKAWRMGEYLGLDLPAKLKIEETEVRPFLRGENEDQPNTRVVQARSQHPPTHCVHVLSVDFVAAGITHDGRADFDEYIYGPKPKRRPKPDRESLGECLRRLRSEDDKRRRVSSKTSRGTDAPSNYLYVIKARKQGGWNDQFGQREERDAADKSGGQSTDRSREIRAALERFLGQQRHRTALLISAEELRLAGFPISYQVSWERTIQGALAVLKMLRKRKLHDYHFITTPRFTIISFGCDGVLIVDNGAGSGDEHPRLGFAIVEPTSTEGELALRHAPRMRGVDSLIIAGIAHHLMQHMLVSAGGGSLTPPQGNERFIARPQYDLSLAINTGTLLGLKAVRFLQVHGFDEIPKTDEFPSLQLVSDSGKRTHACFWDEADCFLEAVQPYFEPPELSRKKSSAADDRAPAHGQKSKARPPSNPGDVVLPLDVLGSIVALGDLSPHSWFVLDPKSEDEQRALRQRGQVLIEEWMKAGWLQSRCLDSHEINEILNKNERLNTGTPLDLERPIHDAAWWSFLHLASAEGYALAMGSANRARKREVRAAVRTTHEFTIAKALARTCLEYGLDWLWKVWDPDLRRHGRDYVSRRLYGLWSCSRFTLKERTDLTPKDLVDKLAAADQKVAASDVIDRLQNWINDRHASFKVPRGSRAQWDAKKPGASNQEVQPQLPQEVKPHLQWDVAFSPGKQITFTLNGESKKRFTKDWNDCASSPNSRRRLLGELLARLIERSPLFAHRESPVPFGFVPVFRIRDFQTVNRREAESYKNFATVIREYDRRKHVSHPLNLGVFGPAGAGKTVAVNRICEEIGGGSSPKFESMTFNLSQFSSPKLLVDAFEAIQDVGLRGRIPVVFWDEFDTPVDRRALGWLTYFLGPMNDGEYFRGERTRKLPKAIFVFAGSLFASFHAMRLLHQKSMESTTGHGGNGHMEYRVDNFTTGDWRLAKGPDFKSRLSGILDVHGVNEPRAISVNHFNDHGEPEPDNPEDALLANDRYTYLIQRAVVIRHSLRQIKANVFDGDRLRIDDNVAEAFLNVEEYTHGARSIDQIIAMCNFEGRKLLDSACLPAASQLRIHVAARDFERWFMGAVREAAGINLED